jgi:2-polyprenyl-6-hydroxyphenyl methylase/3-demethylubiquinone-9 3-methyltransferase
MTSNFDTEELKKFADLAAHWWDPNGELKTLHQINPLRLDYIAKITPLENITILDVGCGGGILSESMANAGANVTGIDLNQSLIDVAKLHQLESKTTAQYRCIAVETLAAEQPGAFDVVTCMEMLEHVPDPAAIVKACYTLVKPGGSVFFSTINRNPKAYLFAIIGAEHLLKLLPKNTHDYAKFIKPSELSTWCREAGLTPRGMAGVSYNPFTQQLKLTDDVSVNYMLHAARE